MKAKDLIKILEKHPEVTVVLNDILDDTNGTYYIEAKEIDLIDCVDENDEPVKEKLLAIMFEGFNTEVPTP